MPESTVLASIVTGSITLVGLCINKCKCFYRQTSEKEPEYGCGFTKKSVVPDNEKENEITVTNLNGLDVMYRNSQMNPSSGGLVTPSRS